MTPDDILEDMVNELIVHKYNAIRTKTDAFSLLKSFTLWVHKFHPTHRAAHNHMASLNEN